MVLQSHALSLSRAVHFDVNLLQHRVEIAGNIGIPEADNSVSFLFQPGLPFAIARCCRVLVVMPAIELNDETFCWTEEVNNVAADRRLTPEM